MRVEQRRELVGRLLLAGFSEAEMRAQIGDALTKRQLRKDVIAVRQKWMDADDDWLTRYTYARIEAERRLDMQLRRLNQMRKDAAEEAALNIERHITAVTKELLDVKTKIDPGKYLRTLQQAPASPIRVGGRSLPGVMVHEG